MLGALHNPISALQKSEGFLGWALSSPGEEDSRWGLVQFTGTPSATPSFLRFWDSPEAHLHMLGLVGSLQDVLGLQSAGLPGPVTNRVLALGSGQQAACRKAI